ncbi:hypothetical protein Ndes2437B_g00695 [Nannochloris sp. 'desiccata']|nr:hypothetical protein KSW81_000085 [Chlorella desiccata (nom. nud.)]
MSKEFIMPSGDPEELWLEDSELPMKVNNLLDFSGGCTDDIGEIAEGVSFKLCDDNPLCIIDQQNFDQLCSLVRCFDLLEGPKRRQLLDALCSSLTCLNAWIDRLMATPSDSSDRDAMIDYRSAFKVYLFFLQWIAKLAGREALAAATNANAAAAPTKARGRKKAVDDGSWDWPVQFTKVMKAVGRALNTDLWALFRPNRPDQNTLVKLIQLAGAALENPAAAKDEELAGGAAHVLAVTAIKYQQLDAVSATLVDALNRFEHTPPLVAELLRYSVAQWDDGRLAAAVIGDIAAVDPSEYERQQNATGEKAGVRSVAAFVEEMASRLPRLMATQIALLLPHLGGKAWTLRSGIVTAIGYLLHKAFDSASTADAADAQRAAHLRSKQHLLDILCERVRDQSSFTRKAVLQTWAYLAENRAVPLGHWQVVTSIAVGRLEDKSSLVRKEALRLLGCLMLHNPFGPALPVDRFDASLAVHKAMLDAVMPPDDPVDSMTETVNVENEEKEGEEEEAMAVDGEEKEAAENAANVIVKEEPQEDGEEELSDEPAALEAEAAQPSRSVGRSPAEVGWDGTVEELQALVASLELAVDFARSLSGCMATLVQLLASSSVSDVQESIALLLTCKQFEIAGAPDAIRKMLPLVFARDQAVKDRIVEALDQLYITGWAGHTFTSAQAARNLVDLASGATLGELGSMEEVVKELVGKKFLTPVTLHELWEIAGRAGAAVNAGAQGSGRARKDLRAALSVLSMAAACKPEAFAEQHVAAFLRLGFASGRAADALTSRHACVALQRLAENLNNGFYEGVRTQIYAALTRTVVASPFHESSWYSAAEAAITALYNLHPAPEHICAAIVRHIAYTAFETSSNNNNSSGEEAGNEEQAAIEAATTAIASDSSSELSSTALSRFFFVLGHVALEHLVLIERTAKAVRRARMEAEKRAAENKIERHNAKSSGKGNASDEEEDEDINAELGVGSVAADAELDAMKEACETQILAAQNLLGPYAALVSAVCRQRSLLSGDATLRASALLALSKLMVVDPRMCEENLQLMFTLLAARSVEPALRSNLTIALGDLALRFPNLLEPWTEHMYRPLGDTDISVRKNALMVLSHLILNDMMKVKGHIAKMAVCLEDDDERISALAELFFHELAKKEYKGTSPIYNLLPDILSSLSKETGLTRAGFQSVMQRLLGYIKKDKQGDALVEKLCQRFASSEDPTQWRNVAFCLAQLPISEKGVRKFAESFKLYKNALGDAETAETIGGILVKAKKSAAKPELKALVEELEVKIEATAAERAEEEAAAAAAADRAAKDRAGTAAEEEDAEQEEAENMEMVDADASTAEVSGMFEEEEETEIDEDEKVVAPAGLIKLEVENEEALGAEEAPEEEEENEEPAVEVNAESGVAPLRRPRSRQVSNAAAVEETAISKRSVRGKASSSVVNTEEEAPARRGRATRCAKASNITVAAAVEESEEPPVANKGRGGRRARAAIVDSEDDNESAEILIAAVQAGMAAIKVEDE